jgi:hypothetical protein
VVTLDQRTSQQLPLSLSPTLLAQLNSRRYQGLVAAASILGGAPVFLFLFARVSQCIDMFGCPFYSGVT